MAANRVQHCMRTKVFFIEFENGSRAFLEYHLQSPSVLDVVHTVVPVEHRGKNYAQTLTEEVLKYAAETNRKVVPTCTYTQRFFDSLATANQKTLLYNNDASL